MMHLVSCSAIGESKRKSQLSKYFQIPSHLRDIMGKPGGGLKFHYIEKGFFALWIN